MLIHVVLVVVGLVLLLTGSAAGIFLLVCALMMAVMMGAMGGHDTDGDDRPSGRSHH